MHGWRNAVTLDSLLRASSSPLFGNQTFLPSSGDGTTPFWPRLTTLLALATCYTHADDVLVPPKHVEARLTCFAACRTTTDLMHELGCSRSRVPVSVRRATSAASSVAMLVRLTEASTEPRRIGSVYAHVCRHTRRRLPCVPSCDFAPVRAAMRPRTCAMVFATTRMCYLAIMRTQTELYACAAYHAPLDQRPDIRG